MRNRYARTYARGAAALVLLAAAPVLGSGRAYVIVGNDNSANVRSGLGKAGDSAEANYQANGYNVIRLNQPTRAQIIAAFQDPMAQAIWYGGHGGKAATGFVPYLAHNPKPGANDGGVRPGDLGAGALNHLRQVVIQGCGQFLDGWRDKFPNATFVGWTGSVRLINVRFDEYWRGKGRIPPKGQADERAALFPIFVDPRITNATVFEPYEPDPTVDFDSRFNDLASWGFTIPSPLSSEFGSKTFNVVVRDFDNPSNFQLLTGLQVSGGMIVDQNDDGYSLPDFVYELSPDAWETTTANVDFIQTVFDSGLGRVVGNMTGVPDRTLFDGASYVIWSVPSPASATMLLGFGIWATRRKRFNRALP